MKVRQLFRKYPAVLFMVLCLLFIGIEAIFSFCSEKKDIVCPTFSNINYDQWFPYATNQSFRFQSPSNSDSLKIIAVSKKSDCSDLAYITSDSSNLLSIHAYGSVGNDVTFKFRGIEILRGAIKDTGLVMNNDGQNQAFLEYQNTVVLNGLTFQNAELIYVDTILNKTDVFKIWLAKDKGIVGYQKRLGNELFVLQ